MIEQTPSPDEPDDSTLGETGLRTLKKLRSEARNLRTRLHESEAQRGSIRIIAWRPVAGPELLGFADVKLGSVTILEVRVVRHASGGFTLSWPARKPLGSDRLLPILLVEPGLDGRVLAAVLRVAFPTVELPG